MSISDRALAIAAKVETFVRETVGTPPLGAALRD